MQTTTDAAKHHREEAPTRSRRLQARAPRSGQRATQAAARPPRDPGAAAPASSSVGGQCRPGPPRYSSQSSHHAGGQGPHRPSRTRRRRTCRRRLLRECGKNTFCSGKRLQEDNLWLMGMYSQFHLRLGMYSQFQWVVFYVYQKFLCFSFLFLHWAAKFEQQV
jgi:hypothetical protein